jgi:hypothetical protein
LRVRPLTTVESLRRESTPKKLATTPMKPERKARVRPAGLWRLALARLGGVDPPPDASGFRNEPIQRAVLARQNSTEE